MPNGKPPQTEDEIRAELKKQGVDNFGQLVAAAARHIRERGDVESQGWFLFVGDAFIFILWNPL